MTITALNKRVDYLEEIIQTSPNTTEEWKSSFLFVLLPNKEALYLSRKTESLIPIQSGHYGIVTNLSDLGHTGSEFGAESNAADSGSDIAGAKSDAAGN